MIDGRGRENGETDRLKAGRFLQIQSRQRAIELHRFHKSEPARGKRGEAVERIPRLGLIERRAQIAAEIACDRQPAHDRTSGGGALQHGNDPIG